MTEDLDQAVERAGTLHRMLEEAQESEEDKSVDEEAVKELAKGIVGNVLIHNDFLAERDHYD